jgi:hypothetical protein
LSSDTEPGFYGRERRGTHARYALKRSTRGRMRYMFPPEGEMNIGDVSPDVRISRLTILDTGLRRLSQGNTGPLLSSVLADHSHTMT